MTTAPSEERVLTCINCGNQCKSTMFKVYGKEPSTKHVKLTDCTRCNKPIDDYIELDDCILYLDALLLKKRFYRHILNNGLFTWQTTFKLSVLFLLSDAFLHWSTLPVRGNSYVEQELTFYIILLEALFANILTYFWIISIVYCTNTGVNIRELLQGLILCSYIKLFQVPAILWSSEFFSFTKCILEVLHLLSITQCLNVKTGKSIIFNLITTCSSRLILYLLEMSVNKVGYWRTLST